MKVLDTKTGISQNIELVRRWKIVIILETGGERRGKVFHHQHNVVFGNRHTHKANYVWMIKFTEKYAFMESIFTKVKQKSWFDFVRSVL